MNSQWIPRVRLRHVRLTVFLLGATGLLGIFRLFEMAPSNYLWSVGSKQLFGGWSITRVIDQFGTAAQYAPESASVTYGLAILQIKAHDYAAAFNTLHRGEQLFPTSRPLGEALLQVNIATGDVPGIVSAASQLGLNPKNLTALANARVAESEWSQAIGLFEAARSANGFLLPGDEYLLGEAYVHQGNNTLAEASFLRVISDPRGSVSIRSEANARLGSMIFWNSPDSAAGYIAAALKLQPENVDALMLAGDFALLQQHDGYMMATNYSTAIHLDAGFAADWLDKSILQTQLKDDPRWLWLGKARENQGDHCAAFSAYSHLGAAAQAGELQNSSKLKCASQRPDPTQR